MILDRLARGWLEWRERGQRTAIVRDGGYQPTRDPGSVPDSLRRPKPYRLGRSLGGVGTTRPR